MFKRPTRWITTAALVVGALTACYDGPGPTEVSVPLTQSYAARKDASPPELKSKGKSEGKSKGNGKGAMQLVTAMYEHGAVAIKDIGPGGGEIRAGAHTLVVPRGAVFKKTRFRMEVLAGEHIIVDLSAVEVKAGAAVFSFRVPLTLSLSFTGVLNVDDAARLQNVYLHKDSPHYLVVLDSEMDLDHQTISSPITHFSQYGMAIE